MERRSGLQTARLGASARRRVGCGAAGAARIRRWRIRAVTRRGLRSRLAVAVLVAVVRRSSDVPHAVLELVAGQRRRGVRRRRNRSRVRGGRRRRHGGRRRTRRRRDRRGRVRVRRRRGRSPDGGGRLVRLRRLTAADQTQVDHQAALHGDVQRLTERLVGHAVERELRRRLGRIGLVHVHLQRVEASHVVCDELAAHRVTVQGLQRAGPGRVVSGVLAGRRVDVVELRLEGLRHVRRVFGQLRSSDHNGRKLRVVDQLVAGPGDDLGLLRGRGTVSELALDRLVVRVVLHAVRRDVGAGRHRLGGAAGRGDRSRSAESARSRGDAEGDQHDDNADDRDHRSGDLTLVAGHATSPARQALMGVVGRTLPTPIGQLATSDAGRQSWPAGRASPAWPGWPGPAARPGRT